MFDNEALLSVDHDVYQGTCVVATLASQVQTHGGTGQRTDIFLFRCIDLLIHF